MIHEKGNDLRLGTCAVCGWRIYLTRLGQTGWAHSYIGREYDHAATPDRRQQEVRPQ